MKVETRYVDVDGHLLHRLILHPAKGIPTRAACIFNHGQGDYAERYLDVLHPFTERGIRCILTDFRGHGRSPGTRGHLGKQAYIDALIRSNLEAAGDLPTGVAGHSMGGLLTLRHLALSQAGLFPQPAFCWVNAPLLAPGNGRSGWFIQTARFLAGLSPQTTIHTGVSPDMCRHAAPDEYLPKDPAELGHQRVSLAWGIELIDIAAFVHRILPETCYTAPFLFTQGKQDIVCPAPIAEAFYSKLEWPASDYLSFAKMRHETFAEPERDQLFEQLGTWIESRILPDLS